MGKPVRLEGPWMSLVSRWMLVQPAQPYGHWLLDALPRHASGILWEYFLKTLVLFAVIGGADLLYSRHSFNKEMMMSKYDVKQEYKQSEGDPHMKGHRRQLAQELLFGGLFEPERPLQGQIQGLVEHQLVAREALDAGRDGGLFHRCVAEAELGGP